MSFTRWEERYGIAHDIVCHEEVLPAITLDLRATARVLVAPPEENLPVI
jgi:hypothetical protein